MQEEEKRNRANTRLPCEFGQSHRGAKVDFLRPGIVQIADRIVAQSRQMDDGIKTLKIAELYVANVFAHPRDWAWSGTKPAPAK